MTEKQHLSGSSQSCFCTKTLLVRCSDDDGGEDDDDDADDDGAVSLLHAILFTQSIENQRISTVRYI